MQIRNLSALKYRHHEVGIGDHSDVVLMVDSGMKYILEPEGMTKTGFTLF